MSLINPFRRLAGTAADHRQEASGHLCEPMPRPFVKEGCLWRMQLQEPKCSITAMWAAGGRYAVGGNDGLSSWGFITSEGPRGSAPRCGALPNARGLAGDGAPPQVPGEPVVQSPGENRGAPFLLGIQNQPVHLLLGEFLCRYAEVVDLPFPTIGRRNAVRTKERRRLPWSTYL